MMIHRIISTTTLLLLLGIESTVHTFTIPSLSISSSSSSSAATTTSSTTTTIATTFLHNLKINTALCSSSSPSSHDTSTNRYGIDDTPRAGEDGYSVLRQPVQWDPNSDPTFSAPKSLESSHGSTVLTASSIEDDVFQWSSTTTKTDENQNQNNNQNNNEAAARQQQQQQQQQIQIQKLPSIKPLENLADLDLFQRTLDTLDYPMVLNALQDRCMTVPAKDFVQDASVSPTLDNNKKTPKTKIPKELLRAFQPLTSTTHQGLQERYTAVQEMQWLIDGERNLMDGAFFRNRRGYKEDLGPPSFGGMTLDLNSILDIADRGKVLEGPEILEIVTMLDVFEDLQLWAKGLQNSELKVQFVELPKLTDCIRVNATLQGLLHNAFDKEGRLSGKTFPIVGQLRAKIRTLKGDILNTLNTIISTPSIASKLALESGGPTYSEVNGRIVIPIDQKYNKASIGIIHDVSRSGKTVYIEPTEIVVPTNDMRQAEAELRAEEARVWRSLTEQVLQNRPHLETSVAAAGQLDLVMAKVALGKKWEGVIPESQNDGVISLRNAKHPVLLLREIDDVVGNDLDLGSDENQGIVLTGPNAGGKTLILKLLGLSALLARNGIPIPANRESADHRPRVDFFDPVLADIGDLQSVGGDLSTFSGHLLVCREVLASSGENALVLMDELGSGTDPAQGVAIAQALLEEIVDTGARVGITTHYSQLKQLAASDDRFSVGGMQFVNGRPTYKLQPGTVGESFALAVAERLNLPQKVIQRANELMDVETRQMGDLIRELEDQKVKIDQQAADMTEKQADMNKLVMRMKQQEIRLEEKQLSARRDEAKKFAKKLEEKEKILEDILNTLQSDPSRKILVKSWDDIKFVKRNAINDAENVGSMLRRKERQKIKMEATAAEMVPLSEMEEIPNLKVGDMLLVCQQGTMFASEAKIVKLGSKRILCKVGAMQLHFKLSSLALPTTTTANIAKPKEEALDRQSREIQRAIEAEKRDPEQLTPATRVETDLTFRTDSNTVDVRGCNMEEAREIVTAFIHRRMSIGSRVVFVLHGYGEKGVLRSKIRNWLKSQKSLVKKYGPADRSDGGDSLTKIELRPSE